MRTPMRARVLASVTALMPVSVLASVPARVRRSTLVRFASLPPPPWPPPSLLSSMRLRSRISRCGPLDGAPVRARVRSLVPDHVCASMRARVRAPVPVSMSASVPGPVRRSTVVRRASPPPPPLRADSLRSVHYVALSEPIPAASRPRAQQAPSARDQSPPYSPFGPLAVFPQKSARNVALMRKVGRNTRARAIVALTSIAHSQQATRHTPLPELQISPPSRVIGAPQTVQTPVSFSTSS